MSKNDLHRTEKSTEPDGQASRWSPLFENIRRIALRKSEAMVSAPCADDEDFDRDARILRTLMGSAEIAQRMRREDVKEQESNAEIEQGRTHSDEDIAALYDRIVKTIDAAERGERRGDANPAAGGADKPDAERSAGRGSAEGMADSCA